MSRTSENAGNTSYIRPDLGNITGFGHDSSKGLFIKHKRHNRANPTSAPPEFKPHFSHLDAKCEITREGTPTKRRGITKSRELSSPYECGNSMKSEVMHTPHLNWEVEVDPWHSCRARSSTPHHRFTEKEVPVDEHMKHGGRVYVKEHIMSQESLEHDQSSDLEVVKRLSPTRNGQLLGAHRIKESLDRALTFEERERRAAKHYARTGEYGFHIERAHNSRKMFADDDHLSISTNIKNVMMEDETTQGNVFSRYHHVNSHTMADTEDYSSTSQTGDASYIKKDELDDEDHVYKAGEMDVVNADVGTIRHTRRSYTPNRSTRPW